MGKAAEDTGKHLSMTMICPQVFTNALMGSNVPKTL